MNWKGRQRVPQRTRGAAWDLEVGPNHLAREREPELNALPVCALSDTEAGLGFDLAGASLLACA